MLRIRKFSKIIIQKIINIKIFCYFIIYILFYVFLSYTIIFVDFKYYRSLQEFVIAIDPFMHGFFI